MMLTSAEPHGKSLVALFIDGEKAADLDAEIYLKSGLHLGDDLDEEQLHELLLASDTRRAEQKAMNLLSFRAHSEKELARKLGRFFPAEAAGRAAARMVELGLVNDEEYAKGLARKLFSRKGFAARRVCIELMRRGISRGTAERAAEEAAPENPGKTAKEILEKKYLNCLNEEKGRRRAAAALRRMGYCWDDIRSAIHELTTDEDE